MTAAPTSEQSVSLLDEAIAYQRRGGTACAVAQTKAEHPDIAADLDAALAANVQAIALSRALKARNIALGDQSISRHRRGDCLCDVAR